MEKLEEIKKEIELERNKQINQILDWKNKLIKQINGNRDVLLYYKVEYQKITAYNDLNIGISVISLAFAIMSIIFSFEPGFQKYNIYLNQATTTLTGEIESANNFGIFDFAPIFVLIAYLLLLTFFVLRFIRKVNYYRVVGVVLEEIDKSWGTIYKTTP